MSARVDSVVRDGPIDRSSVAPLHRLSPLHEHARACGECGVRRMALFGALDVADLITAGDDYEVLVAVPRDRSAGFEAATGLKPIGAMTSNAVPSYTA